MVLPGSRTAARRIALRSLAVSRGFSLVELLVVIAIITILIGLLLPAVQAVRESARRTSCRNNLKQIGNGMQHYHSKYNTFPPGCADRRNKQIAWSAYLLPYIEQEEVYGLFDFNSRYDAPANRKATGHVISTYLCPSTSRREPGRVGDTTMPGNGPYNSAEPMGCTDYGGVYGYNIPGERFDNGVMVYNYPVSQGHIRDGLSKTMMIVEDTGRGSTMDGQWANGENIFLVSTPINTEQNNEIWSDHSSGAHGLFCDGSVHFLKRDLDQAVLSAICTRARGDVVDSSQID
jgi:prepilin-type N-terminal cleavage/methylation domain-containing protein/prepilin-type processing-associated H-X9-DG protein